MKLKSEHEHLDGFGLINMNGRIYDPTLSRVLSVDSYIQEPGFSQSFNRYSYCLNNPLKYTDPDGEWIHLIIGAAIGGVINLATNSLVAQTGTNFSGANNVNWWQFGLGTAVGGVSGIAGYGVGQWASNNIGNVLINGFNVTSPILKGACLVLK